MVFFFSSLFYILKTFSRSGDLFRNAPHVTCDDSALNFLCSITSARLARYANGKVESVKGLTSQHSRPVALAQWQEKKKYWNFQWGSRFDMPSETAGVMECSSFA